MKILTLHRWIGLLVLATVWLTTSPVAAGERDSTIANDIEVDQWQLGVALGLGMKSNPLRGGDDIPLLVLPDISYYGERWFLDNFTLGYSVYQSERLVLSLITGANGEKAYFSFWHPTNFVTLNSSEFVSAAEQGPSFNIDGGPMRELPPVTIDDVSKRRFAWDGGVMANLYLPWGELMIRAMADVSKVYQGTHGRIDWSRHGSVRDWQWRMSVGADWQSNALIDYYYGVPDNSDFSGGGYRGRSGWSPYATMMVSHPINENWQGLMTVKYQKLGSGMADSPLVTTGATASFFIGAAYQF